MKTDNSKQAVEQEEKTILPEGVTEQMIAEWKQKYGKIKLKTVYPEDREPFSTVTIIPNTEVTSEFIKFSDKDFKKAMSILVKNCVLHRKDDIMKDTEIFYSVGKAIADDLPISRNVSKNL